MKSTTKKNKAGRYEINESMLDLFMKLPFMKKIIAWSVQSGGYADNAEDLPKSKELDSVLDGTQEYSSDGKGLTARQILLGRDVKNLENQIKQQGLEDEYRKALKTLRASRKGNRSDYFGK